MSKVDFTWKDSDSESDSDQENLNSGKQQYDHRQNQSQVQDPQNAKIDQYNDDYGHIRDDKSYFQPGYDNTPMKRQESQERELTQIMNEEQQPRTVKKIENLNNIRIK